MSHLHRTAYDGRFISVGVLTTNTYLTYFSEIHVLSGTEIQHPLFIEATIIVRIMEKICYHYVLRSLIKNLELRLKSHYVVSIIKCLLSHRTVIEKDQLRQIA